MTYIVTCIALLLSLLSIILLTRPVRTKSAEISFESSPDVASVTVSDTLLTRIIGLSRTGSLDNVAGMLFIHPWQGNHSYVMRSMDYPIDIVFVSEDMEVTEVYSNISPESSLFSSGYSGVGKYVVELDAGWCEENNVSVGDSASICIS